MHLKPTYSFGRFARQLLFGLAVFSYLIRIGSAASLDTILSTNLFEPYGVAVDLFNEYYITDSANNRILKFDPSTGGTTNIAGQKGAAGAGAVDGSGEFARLYSPEGIVALESGLVVSDTGNHVIRFITYSGLVTTIAGDITKAGTSDGIGFKDGIGTAARFNTPIGLAVNAAGTAIYIADSQNNAIRKLDLISRKVTTVTSISPPSGLLRPSGVAVDGNGLIYVADTGNNSIKSVTEGGPLQLVAGSNSRFAAGNRDAIIPTQALFDTPLGLLWIGGSTGLYVSDSGNHVIRRIFFNPDVSTNSVETVPATVGAGLVTPAGMARDDNNDILIADVGANALRRIVSSETPPPPVSDPVIGTVELVEDTNSGKLVTKVFSVASAIFNNDVIVGISSESGTETFYTKDGTDPSSKNGSVPPPIIQGKLPPSIINPAEPGSQPDTTIKAISSAAGRRSSHQVTGRFVFQVGNPSINGNNPASFSLDTATDNAQLWYTSGDSDANTPDPANGPPAQLYVRSQDTNAPTQINIVQGRTNFAGTNVIFKVRGFKAGYLPSKIIRSSFGLDQTKNNILGVPRDFRAGIGSTIVVPVELTLSSNNIVQSLQFRIEISAVGSTNTPPELQLLSGNSFVPIRLFSPDSSAISSYKNGATNGLTLAFLGTNSTFQIPSSLTVALVGLQIPSTAKVLDKYSISVLYPSATSDGFQHQVGVFADAPRTITVTNIGYRVGDIASATWFNAGDFGDGDLNNSDVNAVFLASLGVNRPFAFTDAFDAMDAFPEDLPNIVGGDGQIRFLDWQVILRRALRLSTNNWMRTWSPGGVRQTSGSDLTGHANTTAQILSTAPAAIWNRQALIGAVSRPNVSSGTSVDVPVYAKVLPNCSLNGLSFRAFVTPQGDAPSSTNRLQFVAAPGINSPLQMFGDASSGLLCGWSLGALSKPLGGSNLLGWVRFPVPSTARSGHSYKLSFVNADGAPDISTQYDFETLPATIWVQSTALAAPDIITPEWKLHFFGSVESPDAAELADPDGDGISNRDEYLAGTDPTDAKSALGLLKPEWRGAQGQILLRWLTAAGKIYSIDLASDLSGPWQPTLSGLIGDGALKEVALPAAGPNYRFYRVRVQP